MKTYVILLRGVTPTGKNRVPMAELRVSLAETGLEDVRTYIQSGNVIAKSALGEPALRNLVHDAIAEKIGADITVITRTPEELRRIMAQNPFPDTASSRVYFSLLASPPAAPLCEEFLRSDFSPDDVKLVGETIYTLYATKLSDSRFTNNFFERKLKVAATTRNYNTLSRLVEWTINPRTNPCP